MKPVLTSVAAAVITALFAPALGEGASRMPPDQALKRLLEGNQRFTRGGLSACRGSDGDTRARLGKGQHPPAIVLTCSDSRLPPELIFDQPIGEIFVVRVAGNVVDPIILGSVEYAAEHLGSSLILVLGHERCGAVTAAVDAQGKVPGNVGAIVDALAPAVAQAKKAGAGKAKGEVVDLAIDANIKNVEADLTRKSAVLARLAKEGAVRILGARYDLDDGRVTFLDPAAAGKIAAEPKHAAEPAAHH